MSFGVKEADLIKSIPISKCEAYGQFLHKEYKHYPKSLTGKQELICLQFKPSDKYA